MSSFKSWCSMLLTCYPTRQLILVSRKLQDKNYSVKFYLENNENVWACAGMTVLKCRHGQVHDGPWKLCIQVHGIKCFKHQNIWDLFLAFFFFLAGDPVLHLCPAGHYCDGLPGIDFNGGTGPRPCPLYSYRALTGAGSKGGCLPCPRGSHCNSTGVKHCASHCSQYPIIWKGYPKLHLQHPLFILPYLVSKMRCQIHLNRLCFLWCVWIDFCMDN